MTRLCIRDPAKRLCVLPGGIANLWKHGWYSGFDASAPLPHVLMDSVDLPADVFRGAHVIMGGRSEAVKASTMPTPHTPLVRSNRDLSNFYSNPEET